MSSLLEVRNLEISFAERRRERPVVEDVSFTVGDSEAVALVGASGAGKSLTTLALLGLVPPPGRVTGGTIRLRGRELRGLDERQYREIRGGRVGLVVQEPASALNPVLTIGAQIVETMRAHRCLAPADATRRATELLDRLALPAAARTMRRYPHELSGGQQQRALLAVALAAEPELLVADEVTSALDPTTRAEILDLLCGLRRERGLALLLVAHDLSVVARATERVYVLRAGRVLEQGTPAELAAAARHGHTRQLFAAAARAPAASAAPSRAAAPPVLEVRGLRKEFDAGSGRRVEALAGVDLELADGEALAVVGESGSGKTTLGRCVLRLVEPSSGSVRFRGEELLALGAGALRRRRRQLQLVFQDAGASLDPRQRVGDALFEPLRLHGLATDADRPEIVERLLAEVGLAPGHARRHPHELSGGERQRVGLARALATRPSLLVADEPVSALDALTRAQVVALLDTARHRRGAALLLLAHDLDLVRRLADRVAVLYLGKIVEEAPAAEFGEDPAHPFSVCLISSWRAAATPGPQERIAPRGQPPDPAAPPPACAFHPRCPIARPICRETAPPLLPIAAQRRVACHFPWELEAGRGAVERLEPFLPGDVK